jgi:dynein heavy chain
MDEHWLDNVLKLLSPKLKANHVALLQKLSQEMRDDYLMSVKKAIGKLHSSIVPSNS